MIRRMIAVGLCGVFGLVLAPACDDLGLGTGGCGGTGGDGAVCNIAAQGQCHELCQAEYDDAGLQCGAIEIEADRKTCQDKAYTAYKECRAACDKDPVEECRKLCDKEHDRCHAKCTKNDPTSGCHAKCNDIYSRCLKECK